VLVSKEGLVDGLGLEAWTKWVWGSILMLPDGLGRQLRQFISLGSKGRRLWCSIIVLIDYDLGLRKDWSSKTIQTTTAVIF
jgi:hypothetical protein